MQQLLALKSRLGVDTPTWYALLSIAVILVAGSISTLVTQGTLAFLGPSYILQQLQIAAFLGVAATGMMILRRRDRRAGRTSRRFRPPASRSR